MKINVVYKDFKGLGCWRSMATDGKRVVVVGDGCRIMFSDKAGAYGSWNLGRIVDPPKVPSMVKRVVSAMRDGALRISERVRSVSAAALDKYSFWNLYGVAYSEGMWTAVGRDGIVFHSNDGETWYKGTSIIDGRSLQAIVGRPNGRWFAAGVKGRTQTSSDYGKTWQMHGDAGFYVAKARLSRAGTVVAVGSGGYVAEFSEKQWLGKVKTQIVNAYSLLINNSNEVIVGGKDGVVVEGKCSPILNPFSKMRCSPFIGTSYFMDIVGHGDDMRPLEKEVYACGDGNYPYHGLRQSAIMRLNFMGEWERIAAPDIPGTDRPEYSTLLCGCSVGGRVLFAGARSVIIKMNPKG